MSAFWVAPLSLALLSLLWFGVQRAWVKLMARPEGSDALDRPGGCGQRCACRKACPNRSHPPAATATEPNP